MKPELIVFDWDGTLMDSAARIVNCMTAALRGAGCVPPPPPEEVRQVIGLGLDEALAALWPEADRAQRQAAIDDYRRRFLGDEPTPMPLFPGARATLDALRAHGFLLAVATGKSRRGLELALARTGLGDRFQATRCADETRSKPHPQMLLEILAALGVAPRAALMVGDTVFDLEMARNAGVPALAVGYGVHEPARLLALEPLGCLDRLDALPAWLRQQGW